MRLALAQFLMAEDGAAAFDWALLAASLATLVVVSVLSATGSFAQPDPASPHAATANAAVSLPVPTGLGS
jgi:Flp pilus assembly pilin Flp